MSRKNWSYKITNYGLAKYIKGWTGKFWRTGDRLLFPLIDVEKEEANCICILLSCCKKQKTHLTQNFTKIK